MRREHPAATVHERGVASGYLTLGRLAPKLRNRLNNMEHRAGRSRVAE